jgi:hypothetical protein
LLLQHSRCLLLLLLLLLYIRLLLPPVRWADCRLHDTPITLRLLLHSKLMLPLLIMSDCSRWWYAPSSAAHRPLG